MEILKVFQIVAFTIINANRFKSFQLFDKGLLFVAKLHGLEKKLCFKFFL